MALSDIWTITQPGDLLAKLGARGARVTHHELGSRIVVQSGEMVFQVQAGVLERAIAMGQLEYDRYESQPYQHIWVLRRDKPSR